MIYPDMTEDFGTSKILTSITKVTVRLHQRIYIYFIFFMAMRWLWDEMATFLFILTLLISRVVNHPSRHFFFDSNSKCHKTNRIKNHLLKIQVNICCFIWQTTQVAWCNSLTTCLECHVRTLKKHWQSIWK